MGINAWSKRLIPILLAVAFLVSPIGAGNSRAQGTSLEIEEAKVTKGDTVTLALTLTRALDGLGRLDATIVSGDPDVLALTSLTPEAVSEEFIQIDTQEKDKIKFKLVDLRKEVNPEDENVELLTFTADATNTGTSILSLEDIKYTDEEGNTIEPTVKEAEIVVESSEAQEKEEESSEEKEEEPPAEEETEEETEEKQESGEGKEENGEESRSEEKVEVEGEEYAPSLETISLKLGEIGSSRFKIDDLPEGLRMVEVWITNAGGLDFNEISFLDPTYFEVVEKTEELVNFRVADFDEAIQPGADELEVAEIFMEAIKPGDQEIRVKELVIWTDSGEKVVREGNSVVVEVNLGPIGRSTDPPGDLDDDGLYEDINGDGELTETDAFILAFNLESKFIHENPSLFDFDQDGRVSFSDAVELIRQIG